MKGHLIHWEHKMTDLQFPTVSFSSVFKSNYLVHRQNFSVFSEVLFFTRLSVKDYDFLFKTKKNGFAG